jgi:alkanesulfonate monooxygenase SsuD/methylene tetrahydromethanopterin reductase-like flavin-dependent oxidoreductase (luciferase family)
MPPRIGLRFDPRSARAEAALLDLALEAEARGVDVLWVAERPTDDEAWVPAAFPLCANLCARTERLRVATGLVSLSLHHPLRVAEDAATLDLISAGRFELGVGLGGDPAGGEHWGVPASERASRFDEALTLVVQAFAGPCSFHGRHFAIEHVEVHPRPETPGGPPLWVGALREPVQRAAAQHGAGLMLRADGSPAAYLDACRESNTRPRLAWLLPDEEPVHAALRLIERYGSDVSDFVLPGVPGARGFAGFEGLRDRLGG